MSDYMFALESHLDAGQNRAVTEISRLATAAGTTVWLTGGAMRDMLRGAPIRDLDFTVERDAVKIGKALASALGGELVSEDSLKRGVELALPGLLRASVSNARTERYAKPGGKPQIGPATIHEDLSRRDLTINAIALTLNRGARGLLIDPTNGQADLVNRELRTTNSMALLDDPSRIFRLIRFQHVLGFGVAARAQSQLENIFLEGLQKLAPAAALAADLRAIALEDAAVAVLAALDAHGLLKGLAPALSGAKLNAAGISRFEKQAHGIFPGGSEGGWLAFLTVLVEKLSPRDRSAVIKALALPASELKALQKLEAAAKKLESTLKSAKIHKPSQVWEAMENHSIDEVLLVAYRSQQRVVQDRLKAYYQKYLPTSQEVTEEMVVATGVTAGTPKYEKAHRAMVITRLNARPKKVVVEEVVAPPPPMAMARGRRPANNG